MNHYVKCALAIMLLIAAAFWIMHNSNIMNRDLSRDSGSRVADYDHFSFYGYPNFVEVRVASVPDAKLYVEVPDGGRYLLARLPEAVAERYTSVRLDLRNDPAWPEDTMVYRSGQTWLEYQDGKLAGSKFELPEEIFRFGSRQEGPYIQLPATTDELIQVFGPPLGWRRPGPKGPPF